jgi:DNA-binding transcriptional ArsR family regulator
MKAELLLIMNKIVRWGENAMSYSVEIGFSPANELYISLYAFLCKKINKRLEIGSDWVQRTRTQLSASFVQKLDKVDLQDFWHPICLLMIQSPENQSTKDFLRWFEKVSIGEVFERLVPYISKFPANLSEVRDQMLDLLAEWDEQYFSRFDSHVLKGLQENQRKWSQTTYKDIVEFTGEVTNGCRFEPKEGLQKVILIPQYHYSPYNHITHFGASTLCLYAADVMQLPEDEPSVTLTRFTRSIGDRSRLKILHYLQKGPKTLNEIANYLGLAKSTVHDHLTILRTSGLVTNHTVGDTATQYSLRASSFRRLKHELELYLHL